MSELTTQSPKPTESLEDIAEEIQSTTQLNAVAADEETQQEAPVQEEKVKRRNSYFRRRHHRRRRYSSVSAVEVEESNDEPLDIIKETDDKENISPVLETAEVVSNGTESVKSDNKIETALDSKLESKRRKRGQYFRRRRHSIKKQKQAAEEVNDQPNVVEDPIEDNIVVGISVLAL